MKSKQVHKKKIIRPHKPPRRQDDKLLKSVFEYWFPSLLRFFYHDADQIFDFDKGIEFLDKQLHLIIPERERSKGDREADLLARVYLKDGTERWVICNIEIEASGGVSFSFRLFQYWYRCIDKFNVPAITIAVYTGDERQPHPSSFSTKLLDTEVNFKFRGFHIFEKSDKELLSMGNPFALVILAAKKAAQYDYLTDKQLNRARVLILQALRKAGWYTVEQIESFAYFLTQFIFVQDKEENRIFDSELEKTSKGELNMGIVETVKEIVRVEAEQRGERRGERRGEQKAEEKKNTEFVTKLLQANKFTIAEIANFATVNEDFVKKIQSSLAKQQKK
ncbi:hypothetical protein SAMN05216436_12019 [bacterium A37T11]|nr:hypothetical protein SAMN05216436_12019 [bacterium A37T11]